MKRIILLIISTVVLLAFLYIIVKPIAECLLIGMLIGMIVWCIKKLRSEE